MALTPSQRLAYLEKWARLHYANYLRYARDHALVWDEKLSFSQRNLVERLTDEQAELYKDIIQAIYDADGIEPPLGYLEDVAYLNYVHLPVLFSRAVNRFDALLPQFQTDANACLEAGEFELADLGQRIVDQVRAHADAIRPYCENEDQLSPA
ncbi:MAG: hypothetical protein KDB07_10080 [Planctomycetes bacterium]|nr:hypothetical protein [Planctomycetota bacterium]